MHISETFEATSDLGEMLDRVEGGAEVVITRRGKAVARLLPLSQSFDATLAQAAAEAIRAMSTGTTLGRGDLKALIEEGRR